MGKKFKEDAEKIKNKLLFEQASDAIKKHPKEFP